MLYAPYLRTVKPSQPVAVNLAHPMARGIESFHYYPTVGNGFWEAVTGKFATPTAGSFNIKASSEGNLLCTNNGACTAQARNQLGALSENITVIARWRTVSLATVELAPVCLYTRTGTGRGIWVGTSTTNSHVFGVDNNSGGLDVAGGSPVSALNTFRTVGVEHHPTVDNNCYGWIDGVPQGQFATGGTSIGVAVTGVRICGNPGNYYSFPDVEVAWAVTYNRRLTDAEHAWWHRNPYAILQGRRLRMPFKAPDPWGAAWLSA